MTELPRFGPSYGYMVMLLHTNDMAEPAQLLDINTLLCCWGAHTAYCFIGCRNHRQLALSQRFYIRLFSRILSRLLHRCSTGSMHLRHKESRIGWASCKILILSYEWGLCYSIAHSDHSSICWQVWSYVWSPDWHRYCWWRRSKDK